MCLRWFVMVDLDGLDIAISYFTESDVSFSKILKAVYCPCCIDVMTAGGISLHTPSTQIGL